MKLPGWAYIVVGLVVAGFSAYIYKTVPKNGEPNGSMALFFFVGMIFILVGFIKLFFKKVDASQEIKYDKIIKDSPTETISGTNKVEQYINKVYQNSEKKETQHTPAHHQSHQSHQSHTSKYAQTHPYKGIHHTSHTTSIACPKCGTNNYSTSIFCSKCGNKMK